METKWKKVRSPPVSKEAEVADAHESPVIDEVGSGAGTCRLTGSLRAYGCSGRSEHRSDLGTASHRIMNLVQGFRQVVQGLGVVWIGVNRGLPVLNGRGCRRNVPGSDPVSPAHLHSPIAVRPLSEALAYHRLGNPRHQLTLLRAELDKTLTLRRRTSTLNTFAPTTSLTDLQHPRWLSAQVLGERWKVNRQSRFRVLELQRSTRT